MPLALFEANEFGTRLGAANGMLCRDNDITLVYHYNYNACTGPGNYAELATCRLAMYTGDLPSTSSNCNGQYSAPLAKPTTLRASQIRFPARADEARYSGRAMQQVAEWLEKLDLGQYAQCFAENDIRPCGRI